jgi:hypothetical protein
VITYLVSGDDDIRPADSVIRRTGRRVRYDNEVNDEAATELRPGKLYIVVAHGSEHGTVSWFKSSRNTVQSWLWVDMPRPPRNVRVYLYSCRVGRRLPRFLKHCEAFGHVDVVPMPLDAATDLVLGFLAQVELLMTSSEFDPDEWRRQLGEYVNRLLVQEVEARTGLLTGSLLVMLRRSLGYVD